MKITSNHSIENAKKIVGCLNSLKVSSPVFSTLGELTKKLKLFNCPYPGYITSYLKRQAFVVKRGDWYIFTDNKPFDYYNFICVVERIKKINNKNSRKKRESEKEKQIVLDNLKEEKTVSGWRKFLIKLFRIKL